MLVRLVHFYTKNTKVKTVYRCLLNVTGSDGGCRGALDNYCTNHAFVFCRYTIAVVKSNKYDQVRRLLL